jgi:hypothetical protein
MVVSVNTGSGYLVELLQLSPANLADNSVFNLDLGIVTKHSYHLSKGPFEKA